MGWETRWSEKHQRHYYFSRDTGQSQWESPEDESVHVCHLLVKSADSRRPSSWRKGAITISEEEAITRIKEFKNQVLESKDRLKTFKDLAEKHSDCNSAKAGGDLGPFARGKMTKEFEDASYSLIN